MEKVGPRTRRQLNKLATTWKQGEHLVISGGTGSGKTALGRHIDQIRIDQGGYVMLFVCKLRPDQTILDDYQGWTRWTTWKRNPGNDNRVLLYPDTSKAKTLLEARTIQREVFKEAVDKIGLIGKWTVDFDEGLYMTDPSFMGLGEEIKMLHALGRSSKLTIITKMQRPSNVPLLIYGSASHAFVGRTREAVDMKRLSEMGGKASARELQGRISGLGRHDFLWLPVAPDWEPQLVNLRR